MENIYTAARPFYVLSKGLGLFVASQEGPASKGLYSSTLYGKMASFTALFVKISLLAWFMIIFGSEPDKNSLTSKLWYANTVFVSFLVFMLFFYQMMRQKSIVKFLDSVHAFDQKVFMN